MEQMKKAACLPDTTVTRPHPSGSTNVQIPTCVQEANLEIALALSMVEHVLSVARTATGPARNAWSVVPA